ncbi:hypothetical protein BH11CYA1_BH11CYA1_31940 [soil metagenome]
MTDKYNRREKKSRRKAKVNRKKEIVKANIAKSQAGK